MKILKIILQLNLILIILSISSCDDDPVTSKNGVVFFDSARFDWTVYDLEDLVDCNGMWCPDSSNVYLINKVSNILIHLRDGIRTDIAFSNFKPMYITGLSNNDIYILGIDLASGNYPAKLMRYDGAAFTELELNIPGNNYVEIYGGFAKSQIEIWFATNKFILKYDGNDFTSYPSHDSQEYIYSIFYDTENNLQYISVRIINIYEYNLSLLQLNNENWNVVFSQTIDTLSNSTELLEFNGNKYGFNGYNTYCLYSFNNSNFSEFLCFSPYYIIAGRTITGGSLNNFSVVLGGFTGSHPEYICHWNGKNWSKEHSIMQSSRDDLRLSSFLNEDIYFFKTDNYANFRTFIYRGIRRSN